MKRATTMLGALAIAAAGFLFAAPAAQAVTCDHYPATPLANSPDNKINDWPRIKEKDSNPAVSHVYNCYPDGSGGTQTTSEFHGMWQAAQNIGRTGTNLPPQYIAKKFFDNKQRIYFYKNLTDLNSHWGTSYSINGKFFGATLRAGEAQNPGVPVGSVGIVREHTDGTVYNLNTVKANTHHELGHAFDLLHNKPSTLSLSYWTSFWLNDQFDLNHMTRAQAFPTSLLPTADIRTECEDEFNAAWDPDTQQGVSNWAFAQCQWPLYTLPEEFFAHTFALRVGNLAAHQGDMPKVYQFIQWMSNKMYDETKTYMGNINHTGWNP